MGMTFAIPDLHGRFDLLQKALAHLEGSHIGGKIVFLGDYIDRGPQSREVVERLMAGPTAMGWEWVCLRGNHEDMMSAGLRHILDKSFWVNNGGETTLKSFGGSIPDAVLNWCDERPMWHDDGKRIFVHAGVEPRRAMPDQGEAVLLWIRYEPRNADIQYPDRYIVHGHTPERNGPMLYEGRCNLDTYAVGTGRLCIAAFDDEIEGGPVAIIEITLADRVAA